MTENRTENFAKLLNEYEYEPPRRGQVLKGEVKTIDDESIILDIGAKRAAIVPQREVKNLDEETLKNISVGEVIPVQVTVTPNGDEHLFVSIEGAKEYQTWERLGQLMHEDATVELEVVGSNKGGVIVRFDHLEGFVPNSLIPSQRKIHQNQLVKKHKQRMIGAKLEAKPIEVDWKNQKLVFSVVAAQEEKRRERLMELEVGSVVEGTVVNLVKFGAFVELDGIDGLLHISELDWKTVQHPSEILSVGDTLEVQIKQIDLEQGQISLSRRSLLPSPWQVIAHTYQPGDLVEVKIVNVVDFGAFAEIVEGVHGLIHVSEYGYPAAQEAQFTPQVGETVLVKILKIDVDRQRVALSMKQVPAEEQLAWLLKT